MKFWVLVTFTARPKPEKVFGTQPSGEIFTGTKPEKPERVVVFKTEPTGIVHTIEGYVKPEKPERVNVFGVGSGREWITPIISGGASWDIEQNVSFDSKGNRILGVGHLTTQGLEGKSRCDWSGCQEQLWSDPQYSPQKTKFPYMIITELARSTGRKGGRQKLDISGGQWFFEKELVMSYDGDKHNFNIWQDGYTGGKILMTKQEARNLGFSSQQIVNYYFQDKLIKERSESLNVKPNYFFEYRKDGSIIGINEPEPIPEPIVTPEPEPIVTPEPEMTLADPYANGMDHKEVVRPLEDTPAEPDIDVSGQKEVPGDAPITTPEPLNLLPYAIVIGAVIGVGSVVLRKKGAN